MEAGARSAEPTHPVEPPSGWLPPASLVASDGEEVDLIGPARAASDALIAECPEYLERYGAAGRQWCVHDHQHVLRWALTRSEERFLEELAWLTEVLSARNFPLAWLARSTELLAEAFLAARPDHPEVAQRLRRGADAVRVRAASSEPV